MPTKYEILGVSRDASPEEIKRAYRALSLKWHPDRNTSPEAQSKSQEINDAYETLSDERRRQEYNMQLDGVHAGPEVDLNDIFNMMFSQGFMGGQGGTVHFEMGQMPGGGMPGIHIFHGQMPGMPPHPFFQQQMQKPPPIIQNIEVSFEQAYNGCTICINVEKWHIEHDMKIHESVPLYLNIPQGIDNGEIIIARDCGNVVSEELKGDIKFIVKVNNSEIFERNGMDLLYKRTINLKEALTGFSFEITHVNGKSLCLNNLKNRTIISPKYRKTIPNLGMVRNGNVGNLIIEFDVEFPEKLTEEQMEKIEEIL